MKKKKVISCILAAALAAGGQQVWTATTHYNDSSVTGSSAGWNAHVGGWDSLANDYTHVFIVLGMTDSQPNFAWYTEGIAATPVVCFGTDAGNLKPFTESSGSADTELTGGEAYSFSYVTVTGLKENTTYYCSVNKDGMITQPEMYGTGSFENVNILYVGGPQIGTSRGQPQGEGKLAADSRAASTAARNDGLAWDRTLDIATTQHPDLNFVISAGDQVNRTGEPKEEEYAACLSVSALKNLSVATTISNHDSPNPDYAYYFNNPDPTGLGAAQAGRNYCCVYGSDLFVVLNINNYDVAEHEQSIKKAVENFPDTVWHVVAIHQDIYGSGLDHSGTGGVILRTQLVPVFDRYSIDVVLQGHDHTYSRSRILYGDGQTHNAYESGLNGTRNGYGWDNAYSTGSGEKIPLYPGAEDAVGTAAPGQLTDDNHCYTIGSSNGNFVTNPKGTPHMTADSASGSKCYELISSQQDCITNKSQNRLSSYSIINMTPNDFKITTYQITDDRRAEMIDSTFTIRRTVSRRQEKRVVQLKKQYVRYTITAVILTVAVLWVTRLSSITRTRLINRTDQSFETSVVVRILQDNMQEDGIRIGQQTVVVRMTSGEKKGGELTTTSSVGYPLGTTCTVGMRVAVIQSIAGDSVITSVHSMDHKEVIIGFAVLYLGTLCVIGGKKGVRGVLRLVFTFVAIIYVYPPLVYQGQSPFMSAAFTYAITAVVTLYLIGGAGRKAVYATAGALVGAVIAGGAAAIFSRLSGITGWDVSDIKNLLTLWQANNIRVGGLLSPGLLISSLDAVMDVAMSISSSMQELCSQNPKISRLELMRIGMRVGRDMMGTDSNTLVLAFAGTSLSMLVLDYVHEFPYPQIVNSNNIGIAVMQGLSGSFGVVLTMPAVVLMAAYIYRGKSG